MGVLRDCNQTFDIVETHEAFGRPILLSEAILLQTMDPLVLLVLPRRTW